MVALLSKSCHTLVGLTAHCWDIFSYFSFKFIRSLGAVFQRSATAPLAPTVCVTDMPVPGLRELATAYRSGTLLPSSQLAASLRRQKRSRHLNSFVTETPKLAEVAAAEADRRLQEGRALGLLDGIPVSFKDNFCTAGVRTTCGSRMLEDFTAPYNATVVQRCLDGGAVMLGKTNLDEFAMGSGTLDSCHGATRNPWCEEEWVVAGGSSGGSAVSVATGVVAASLGSDTGGSVRIPAAWCGVVSLKPTYGRLSRHGLVPLVNSLDCPGILTRTVGDAATMLQCLEGEDSMDSTSLRCAPTQQLEAGVQGLRVGVPQEFLCEGMSPEVVEVWSRVAELLEQGGAEVVPVSLPHTELAIPCYSVLNPCEVASNMARYDGLEYGLRAAGAASTEDLYAQSRSQGFNEVVRGRVLAGNYFLLKENYSRYYLQALKVRRLILEDYLEAWRSVDLLLTPVTLTDAPTLDNFSSQDNRTQTALQDFCTQPINLAGLPALTLPAGLSARGLPLAVQLVGPRLGEGGLLGVGAWLETRLEFRGLEVPDCESSRLSSLRASASL